jgi:hypothetical protein
MQNPERPEIIHTSSTGRMVNLSDLESKAEELTGRHSDQDSLSYHSREGADEGARLLDRGGGNPELSSRHKSESRPSDDTGASNETELFDPSKLQFIQFIPGLRDPLGPNLGDPYGPGLEDFYGSKYPGVKRRSPSPEPDEYKHKPLENETDPEIIVRRLKKDALRYIGNKYKKLPPVPTDDGVIKRVSGALKEISISRQNTPTPESDDQPKKGDRFIKRLSGVFKEISSSISRQNTPIPTSEPDNRPKTR